MLKQIRSTCWPRAAALIGGILLIFGADPILAADWSFDPKIAASYEFDDNVRLTETPGQEIKVSGGAIDALLRMQMKTPRTVLQLIPRLNSTFFPGKHQEETDNQYMRMRLQHSGERSESRIDAKYSRVETLGTYFPPAGAGDDGVLGQPGRGDTVGRTTIDNREERLEVDPEIRFELSERHGIAVGAKFLDVMFDQQVQNDREDFSEASGWAAYQYKLSPTKTASVIAGVSRFELDDGTGTDSQSINLGWSNRISEASELFVRAGANRSDFDAGGSATGFNGSGGVRWSFEVTDLFLDLYSGFEPTSAGQVAQRNQLRFQISRRLSPLTTIQIGGRFIQDAKTHSSDEFERRQYLTGSIGMSRRFSRQWSLAGTYTYVWRKYESSPEPAEANRLSLGVTYEPHRAR